MWIVNKENRGMINTEHCSDIFILEDNFNLIMYYGNQSELEYTIIKFESSEEVQKVFDDLQLAIAQGDRIFYIGRE